jgi:hypothetical protein
MPRPTTPTILPTPLPAAALACALLSLPGLALGYGESASSGDGGPELPSAEERALHLFTDRLRADPAAADADFADLPAVRPLVRGSELGEAARFYASDMAENGCFPPDHSSCDGTPFGTRLAEFYSGAAIGENIAAGYGDAESTILDGWLRSDGHRANMLDDGWIELGTGHARGGGMPYWVQDFGSRSGVEEPGITSATAWPLEPSPGDAITIHAAFHDAEGAAPAGLRVGLGGSCRDLSPDRGARASGTWARDLEAPGEDGCHPWALAVTRADGSVVRYPSTGALLLPVGDAACAAWTAEEDASLDCLAEPAGGGGPAAGAGCAAGDGPEPLPAADGSGPGSGNGPNATTGEDADYGGCALSGGPSRRDSTVVAGVFLSLVVASGAARARSRSDSA